MTTRGRIGYLDRLRILATFAVILLHVAAQRWDTVPVTSASWDVFQFYDAISRWSVPVFVMISGALMLSKDRPLKTLFRKNILRLVIAFLFWSAIYAAMQCVRDGSTIIHFFSRLIRGEYHLWFLYMIVGLYLLVPFLRKIVESRRLSEYFLLLTFAFTFAIPQMISLLNLVSKSGSAYLTDIVRERMQFFFTLGYVGYFVLGDYLHRYEVSRRLERVIYVLGAVGLLVTIFGTRALSRSMGAPSQVFYGYLTCNVMAMAVAVFLLGKRFLNRDGEVGGLADLSFGAYLTHVLFLMGFEALGLTTESFFPALAVPVIAVLAFLCSMAASFLLHQIPVLRDYMV